MLYVNMEGGGWGVHGGLC